MLFTVGHSNYPPGQLEQMLVEHDINTLMDVRSHPGSTKYPHFNQEHLEHTIPAAGIDYIWSPRLGGWAKQHEPWHSLMVQMGVDIGPYCCCRRFPKHVIARQRVAEGVAWTNRGLYDYSWFTGLPEFLKGADALMRLGRHTNVAIMCAEVLWWKCHRSLIADYVVWRGEDIQHLQPRLTSHRAALGNRLERYDDRIRLAWQVGGFTLEEGVLAAN